MDGWNSETAILEQPSLEFAVPSKTSLWLNFGGTARCHWPTVVRQICRR